jgi:class 3 adenylate cyclase
MQCPGCLHANSRAAKFCENGGAPLSRRCANCGTTPSALAARMEQMAMPGSILMTPATVRLAEGAVRVKPLGLVPVKGLAEPIEEI